MERDEYKIGTVAIFFRNHFEDDNDYIFIILIILYIYLMLGITTQSITPFLL